MFVECGASYHEDGPDHLKPVGETEFVLEQAALSRHGAAIGEAEILGMVGHANLMLGGVVEEALATQQETGGTFLKGIRHSASWDADEKVRAAGYSRNVESLFLRDDFRQGFAKLAPAGLTFDAWLLHPQIPELTDLARAFPETTIILDHFGGPLGVGPYAGTHKDYFPAWQKNINDLVACENVVAKLGGMAMPMNGFGWDGRATPATSDEFVAAQRDFYLHAIDCFGPGRCMFESNFPMDRQSISYPVLWNGLKKIAAAFSETEKDQLFRGTAARVYKLDA